MIIDVHAHYDDEAFLNDLEDVMARLKEENIIAISSSSSIESSKENIEIAKKYDTIYITVGIHPHEAKDAPNDFEDVLFEFARFEKNVAIGEIGLDYHYDFSPRDVQKEVFIIGVMTRIEIWSENNWLKEMTNENLSVDRIAQKMEELGI